MLAALGATAETGDDYAIEYRSLWPDGSVHWARSGRAWGARRRRLPRLVGVSSDITDRKAAETGTRALNETLGAACRRAGQGRWTRAQVGPGRNGA